MTPTTRRSQYIAGLGALRALAFLMIFSYHTWQNAGSPHPMLSLGLLGSIDLGHLLAQCAAGTTLFFVLSGFLLSLPYWQGGGERLLPFMARRIKRVYPPYAVAVVIYVGTFTLWGWTHARWSGDIAAHMLLVHNLFEFSVFGISPPWWYLATQMQLYLAVPLTFALLRRVARQSWARDLWMAGLWILGGVAVLPVTRLVAWLVDLLQPAPHLLIAQGSVLFASPLVHLAEFATGIALARVYLWLDGQERRLWHWGVPLAMLGAGLLWPPPWNLPIHYWPLFPLAMASLVLTVSLLSPTRTPARLLESTPINWLGGVSYGAFLYHGMAIAMVFHRYTGLVDKVALLGSMPARFVLTLLLSLAMGAVSYYVVERPNLLQLLLRRRDGGH